MNSYYYDDDGPDDGSDKQKSRRRASQNQASRNYRQRKKAYVHEIEDKLENMRLEMERLKRETRESKMIANKLLKENAMLKNGKQPTQSDIPGCTGEEEEQEDQFDQVLNPPIPAEELDLSILVERLEFNTKSQPPDQSDPLQFNSITNTLKLFYQALKSRHEIYTDQMKQIINPCTQAKLALFEGDNPQPVVCNVVQQQQQQQPPTPTTAFGDLGTPSSDIVPSSPTGWTSTVNEKYSRWWSSFIEEATINEHQILMIKELRQDCSTRHQSLIKERQQLKRDVRDFYHAKIFNFAKRNRGGDDLNHTPSTPGSQIGSVPGSDDSMMVDMNKTSYIAALGALLDGIKENLENEKQLLLEVYQKFSTILSPYQEAMLIVKVYNNISQGDDYNQPSNLQMLHCIWDAINISEQEVVQSTPLQSASNNRYNQPIAKGVLPNSLTSIRFGDRYNQRITKGVLPNSLTSLQFRNHDNQPKGVLPDSLTSLKFGDKYNRSIAKGVLPNSLTSIQFRKYYNQPIAKGVLPNSLTSIQFGVHYNKLITKGVLPDSLTSIQFGDQFDQPIAKGVLPNSLKSIQFGDQYNQKIEGVLPNSLTSIQFGDQYSQPITKGVLPDSLTSIQLGYYNQPITIGVLPHSLTTIQFGYYYNQPIAIGVLPNSLTSIQFGDQYNQPIEKGVLPNSLTSIRFGYRYNQPITEGVLPNSLTSMQFGYYYNQPIAKGLLPNSLTSIQFGDQYNQPITKGVLPNGLTTIQFGDQYNQPITEGVLPDGLVLLRFGQEYTQFTSLNIVQLETLEFGNKYNHDIDASLLPSLKSLKLGQSFRATLKGVSPLLQSLNLSSEPAIFFSGIPKHISGQALDILENKRMTVPLSFSLLKETGSSSFSIQNATEYDLTILLIGPEEKLSHIFLARGESGSIQSLDKLAKVFLKVMVLYSSFQFVNEFKCENRNKVTIRSQMYADYVPLQNGPKSTLKHYSTELLEFKQKKYIILYKFGHTSNQVYLVLNNSQISVCKIVKYGNSQHQQMLLQKEVDIMKLFINYDNFVQYIDHFDDDDNKQFYIVTKYCTCGDLEQIIKIAVQDKKSIEESTIWSYISQVFKMLEQLESKNILHLDIKPLNLFIGENGQLVLGDFGASKYISETQKIFRDANQIYKLKDEKENSIEANSFRSSVHGTEGYLSPEATLRQYGKLSDIYSLGSTIHKLLCCHPDDNKNRKLFLENKQIIISSERYSSKLIGFVKKLLEPKQEDRVSLEKTLEGMNSNDTLLVYELSSPIKEPIPNNITELVLMDYNHPIEKINLPSGLLKLKLLGSFNQPIKKEPSLPMLWMLVLGQSFNSPIEQDALPTSLEIFVCSNKKLNIDLNPIITTLPKLKHLTYYRNLIDPPPPTSLISLTTTNRYNIDRKNVETYINCDGCAYTSMTKFIPEYLCINDITLVIGNKQYGLGYIQMHNEQLKWISPTKQTQFTIFLGTIRVVSFRSESHIYCQIDKKHFKHDNQYQLNEDCGVDCDPEINNLFHHKFENENIHGVFNDHMYLNIRFIQNRHSTNIAPNKWIEGEQYLSSPSSILFVNQTDKDLIVCVQDDPTDYTKEVYHELGMENDGARNHCHVSYRSLELNGKETLYFNVINSTIWYSVFILKYNIKQEQSYYCIYKGQTKLDKYDRLTDITFYQNKTISHNNFGINNQIESIYVTHVDPSKTINSKSHFMYLLETNQIINKE
ncbi:FNIP repeat-containing protein [Cavenderia fasciculata]|uniref:FNIP repeat-containing protein n=1 Tax=Cavenderia fasciculata TaxID=261658 RepID=F4PQ69_CACFS|nr:FNIP repeat-containing protein [Cavenderia fasciculata]EGG22532.1 FNIP repeat-containing protein [Cavenderia fasciculata]|eukprot:XP_004360383.1 FNIP repeat-containing protein [Cavenderia fasciculata]